MNHIRYQTRLLSIMSFVTLFRDSSLVDNDFYSSIRSEFKNIELEHFIQKGTVSVEEDNAWVYTNHSLAKFYKLENTSGKSNFKLFVFEN
jgi:hypothetical protein